MTTFHDPTERSDSATESTIGQADINTPPDLHLEAPPEAFGGESNALVPYDVSTALVPTADGIEHEVNFEALPRSSGYQRQTDWSSRLVGTGMLAATVVSGLMLADAMNKPAIEGKQSVSTANAPQSNPEAKTLTPQVSEPESFDLASSVQPSAEDAELAGLKGPVGAKGPLPQSAGGSKTSDRLALQKGTLAQRFTLNSNFKMGTPILRSVKDLPTITVSPTPATLPGQPLPPPPNVLTELPPPPTVGQVAVDPTAATAPKVTVTPINEPAQNPGVTTPQVSVGPVLEQPAGSPVSPPAQTGTPAPGAIGVNPPPTPADTVTPVQPTAVTNQPGAPEFLPVKPVVPGKEMVFQPSGAPSLPAATTPSSSAPQTAQTVPQSIQDFVQLPPQKEILPLTQQAAKEALATNQVKEFRVFRLSMQDYQTIWRNSNQGLKDLAPVNGFVDYSQQVIIVPRPAADVTTAPTPTPQTVSAAAITEKTVAATPPTEALAIAQPVVIPVK